MSLRHLDESDRAIVAECLRAAVEGPFFPEWEFRLLVGLDRRTIADIAERWPDVGEDEHDVEVGVHNVLGNLLGYPHDLHDRWAPWISVSSKQLEAVFERWRIPSSHS